MSDATLSKLRDATIFGRLFYGPTDGTSVPGRSIAWKVMRNICLQSKLDTEASPAVLIKGGTPTIFITTTVDRTFRFTLGVEN
jgi:hypothetical protein